MSTIQQTGFGQTLSRASVLPVFLITLLAAYLVPTQLFAHTVVPLPSQDHPVVWKAAYSEMYPGCVATLLWPADETPVALVVMGPDGVPARVTQQEAQRRASTGQVASTIGVCRTPQ